ncbi:MFS transporter [Prescottella equi]|uniref:MFS transporter n=1 Tax=Rhodococcus hoagii TaxID=43767 RepID=UPI001C79318F|nr:MFS transporter [Prescottella equi]BCN84023.1 MFS transporter [Prescottella equi]
MVASATFVVVAAEMMPVGLLTPIGATLAENEGTIGLSLTITGLVAAASAPFIPAVTSRIDRRSTLIVLMLLVATANALTALATSFTVLAVARVLLRLSMGGVWALAASMGPRLVRGSSVGIATTVIFSGIAVASVVGVPAGTYIGDRAGWSAAFWTLAAAATVIALAMPLVVPNLPSEGVLQLGSLAAALRSPGVRSGLALTAFLVTAHFSAYTYIRPALESFTDISASLIGALLLIYGILGVVGNFTAGPIAEKAPSKVAAVISLGIAATLAAFPVVATTATAAALLMAAWGLFYGGVSVGTQTWVAQSTPHREALSALWVGIFNASIAFGAFGGGQVYDRAGPSFVFWIAAGTASIALLFAIAGNPSNPRKQAGRPRRRSRDPGRASSSDGHPDNPPARRGGRLGRGRASWQRHRSGSPAPPYPPDLRHNGFP